MEQLNQLTWPGALAVAAIVIGCAWVLREYFKGLFKD